VDSRKTHSRILVAAALYNVFWGAFVVFFPHALFDWAGLPRPSYPGIWQCVGMIVGVYGVGYWVASWDPYRHWPIVLVGFLGKIFGPIGFIDAYSRDVFNLKFGATIVFNDLIWWIPFYLILRESFQRSENFWRNKTGLTLDQLELPNGEKLLNRSEGRSLIFLFVRHEGCTFCRESLQELSKVIERFMENQHEVYVVHMGSKKQNVELASRYGLEKAHFISDPDLVFYKSFKIRRASFGEAFNPKVLWRGFMAGVFKGHGVGALRGDGFQMGGSFQVKNSKVIELHRPKDVSHLEDWSALLERVEST
jgi:peroxiredoxin